MRQGAGDRDDAVLLRAVARGDEGALAALYDRHAGWLTIRMTRRCAMPDVVDQAVQDTFLVLWRDSGSYRGRGDVAAFIWGIGIRRLIDAIRGENSARRLPWRAQAPEVVVSAEDQVLVGIEHGRLGQALAGFAAIALVWYLPVTGRYLVEPPATADGVTVAWYAIATAALALTCVALRDQWHRARIRARLGPSHPGPAREQPTARGSFRFPRRPVSRPRPPRSPAPARPADRRRAAGPPAGRR
jgi:Sigma-70 region 2